MAATAHPVNSGNHRVVAGTAGQAIRSTDVLAAKAEMAGMAAAARAARAESQPAFCIRAPSLRRINRRRSQAELLVLRARELRRTTDRRAPRARWSRRTEGTARPTESRESSED